MTDRNRGALLRLEDDLLDVPIDLGEDVVEAVGVEVREDLLALHPTIADIDPFLQSEEPGQPLDHPRDGRVVGGVARIDLDRDGKSFGRDDHAPTDLGPIASMVSRVAELREGSPLALIVGARQIVAENSRRAGGAVHHPLVDPPLERILARPEPVHRSIEQVVVEAIRSVTEKERRGGVFQPLEESILRGRVVESIEDHRLDELRPASLPGYSSERFDDHLVKPELAPEEVAEGDSAILPASKRGEPIEVGQQRGGSVRNEGIGVEPGSEGSDLARGDGAEVGQDLGPHPGPFPAATGQASVGVPPSTGEIQVESVGHERGMAFGVDEGSTTLSVNVVLHRPISPREISQDVERGS